MKFRLEILCVSNNQELHDFYKEEAKKRGREQWVGDPNKDAGVDIFCPKGRVIQPGETVFLPLGIKCALSRWDDNELKWLPSAFYLYPRSSISKTPLRLANSVGIVDSGYRGQIIGAVDHIKYNDEPYRVIKGQRLFQLCTPNLEPIQMIKIVNNLDDTLRGEGGFGSTGV